MEIEVKEPMPTAFPRDSVVAALEGWWEMEKADAALPGDPAPSADVMKPFVEIDSHRAVRALIVIQDVVKFEIPETAIKEGGYSDFDEMREHLVPRIAALFEEKRKKEHA